MSGGNADADSPNSPGDKRVDDLEDDLAEAVERSYAMRLTSAPDLSDEERQRIREKRHAARTSTGSDQAD